MKWNIFRYLADFSHLISILILLYKIITKKSCKGISVKTQILYLIVFITRYYSVLFDPPLYNILFRLFYIATSILFIILIKAIFKTEHNETHDTFNIYFLIIPCLPLGYFTAKYNTLGYILWTFSLWLESVTILPQLFLLRRTKKVDVLSADYIFFLGMYRLFYILNWIAKAIVKKKTYPVTWATGIIQTLIYLDFLYYYIKAKLSREEFSLPV